MGQVTELLLTKTDLATTITEYTTCQHLRTLGPQCGTIPEGQLAHWWQVNYIGLLPPHRRKCFLTVEIDNYVGHGFAFLAYAASPKIPSMNWQMLCN